MNTATFNGHKNWQYWNVSLWIANDEGLYNMARRLVRRHTTRANAAKEFVEQMALDGFTETPDGAKYSVPAVSAAMCDL